MRRAAPNTVYTQQGAKPACQQDSSAKCSQLLLAQLPRTQFTHSKAPNPHVSKTSAQNFRSSYWHGHPERHSHTASRRTRNASNTSTQTFRSSYWHGYPERRLHTASCRTPQGRNTSRQNSCIFYCRGINIKVSQLLCNYGDADLSHRHLLCKRQYNYGDTGLSHRHLLCKHQYTVTAAAQICHTDTPPLQTPI